MNTDTDIVEGNTTQLNGTVKEDIPSRRAVLRGALAVGCGLLLPAAFLSTTATSANAAVTTATKKVSKASVQYQAQPKGTQKCGQCMLSSPSRIPASWWMARLAPGTGAACGPRRLELILASTMIRQDPCSSPT